MERIGYIGYIAYRLYRIVSVIDRQKKKITDYRPTGKNLPIEGTTTYPAPHTQAGGPQQFSCVPAQPISVFGDSLEVSWHSDGIFTSLKILLTEYAATPAVLGRGHGDLDLRGLQAGGQLLQPRRLHIE